MELVLIESPYAGDVEANIRYARLCVLDSLQRGEAPYASHLFFTQQHLLDDTIPDERKRGIEAGLAWGERADRIAVYLDRGLSAGMETGLLRHLRRTAPIMLRSIGGMTKDLSPQGARAAAILIKRGLLRSSCIEKPWPRTGGTPCACLMPAATKLCDTHREELQRFPLSFEVAKSKPCTGSRGARE